MERLKESQSGAQAADIVNCKVLPGHPVADSTPSAQLVASQTKAPPAAALGQHSSLSEQHSMPPQQALAGQH